MTSRVGALVSSVLLVLGFSVAVAAPAQAAGSTTISFDPASGMHVVDARAQATGINIGWDSSRNAVSFRASSTITSWPANCQRVDNPPLGEYVYCPGASVAGVVAVFGAGPDTLRVEGVCIDYVGALLGDGTDTYQYLDCATASSEVMGEGGDDWIRTADGADIVDGGPGDDDLRTLGGNDQVAGGDGNDILNASTGNDTLSGGAGNDTIYPGPGNDVANGDDGNDILASLQGAETDTGADDLRGGPGADLLDMTNHVPGATITLDDVANDGNSGEGDNYRPDFEQITGTSGNDVVVGTNNPDYIRSGPGNDNIKGLGGNDDINSGSEDDVVDGGDGNDTIFGEYGNDDLTGGPGTDSLNGDISGCSAWACPAGSDIIRARDGVVDSVNCGAGADQAIIDGIDVLGADGFQLCESVDATKAADPPSGGGTGNGSSVKVGSASRSKGVKATLTCVSACRATGKVVVSKKVQKALRLKSRVLGTTKKSLKSAGRASVKIRIAPWAQQKLKGRGVVKATLSVTVKAGSTATITKSIRLKP